MKSTRKIQTGTCCIRNMQAGIPKHMGDCTREITVPTTTDMADLTVLLAMVDRMVATTRQDTERIISKFLP